MPSKYIIVPPERSTSGHCEVHATVELDWTLGVPEFAGIPVHLRVKAWSDQFTLEYLDLRGRPIIQARLNGKPESYISVERYSLAEGLNKAIAEKMLEHLNAYRACKAEQEIAVAAL